MPSTRCAPWERAHRQGRARAGGAPQRDVGRPPPALRGNRGACCGHTAAAAAAAGAAGRGGRAVRDCGRQRGRAGRRHAAPRCALRPSLPSSFHCSSSPTPPRAAGRSIRLLCGSTDCSCPRTSARCVCGWRAGKGEGGARRGDKIIAFSSTILGDARPALHPRQTQQAVRIRPGAWKSRPPVPLCNALCGRGCSQG